MKRSAMIILLIITLFMLVKINTVMAAGETLPPDFVIWPYKIIGNTFYYDYSRLKFPKTGEPALDFFGDLEIAKLRYVYHAFKKRNTIARRYIEIEKIKNAIDIYLPNFAGKQTIIRYSPSPIPIVFGLSVLVDYKDIIFLGRNKKRYLRLFNFDIKVSEKEASSGTGAFAKSILSVPNGVLLSFMPSLKKRGLTTNYSYFAFPLPQKPGTYRFVFTGGPFETPITILYKYSSEQYAKDVKAIQKCNRLWNRIKVAFLVQNFLAISKNRKNLEEIVTCRTNLDKTSSYELLCGSFSVIFNSGPELAYRHKLVPGSFHVEGPFSVDLSKQILALIKSKGFSIVPKINYTDSLIYYIAETNDIFVPLPFFSDKEPNKSILKTAVNKISVAAGILSVMIANGEVLKIQELINAFIEDTLLSKKHSKYSR